MKLRYETRFIVDHDHACYHVISRITSGEHRLKDREKEVLRKMLWRQAAFSGVQVITYALMSNHIHLLVRIPYVPEDELTDDVLLERYEALYGGSESTQVMSPSNVRYLLENEDPLAQKIRRQLKRRMGDLAVFMQELKRRFTRWYNHEHQSFGTVWAHRYKSLLVEERPDVLRIVAAYIDLNPIRAGLKDDPADYRFCGYAEAMAGNKEARAGYRILYETQDWEQTIASYRLFLFDKGGAGKTDDAGEETARIPEEVVDEVTQAGGMVTWAQHLRCRCRYMERGLALGEKSFLEALFESARERFSPKRCSGRRPIRSAPRQTNVGVMRSLK